jgi:thymidylate kinase
MRRLSRRPAIVALSGLDGAGKSLQAEALRDTLGRLGIEATVVWPPSRNPLFQMAPALKQRLLRLLQRLGRPSGGTPAAGASAADAAPVDADDPHVAPLPRQGTLVTFVLATLAAVAQLLALRAATARRAARGEVVICDRYVLDAIVYVRHRWGEGRRLRLQGRLLRRLARDPVCSYFLAIPPEAAFERKQDFPIQNLRERAVLYEEEHRRLGVKRLDAQLPPDRLCAEIARDVWRRVG